MRRSTLVLAVWRGILLSGMPVWAVGCGGDPRPPTRASAVDLFVPTTMRIHPIFTQFADLSGSGKPDGIEAQLEFDDQFGDPTKASGQVLFELFEYHRELPFTGRRVAEPWVASLATPAEQRARWNKTLRTYSFPLLFPAVNPSQTYVLTATFELTGGGRFPIDKRVITGHRATEPKDEGKGGPFGL